MAEDNFDWLVENRSKIQEFLLKLYHFKRTNNDPLKTEGKKSEGDLWCDLVGTAFSLWRAVFLSDRNGRNRPDIIEKAGEFLKKVIEDNIIGYSQEKDTKKWSGGYYINNARLRVARQKNRLGSELINENNKPIFDKFDVLDRGGIETQSLNDAWVTIYDAASQLFVFLENRMR